MEFDDVITVIDFILVFIQTADTKRELDRVDHKIKIINQQYQPTSKKTKKAKMRNKGKESKFKSNEVGKQLERLREQKKTLEDGLEVLFVLIVLPDSALGTMW